MELKKLIILMIKGQNFDGYVTKSENGSRLVWWEKGDTRVNKLDRVSGSKTTTFTCIDGKLSLF